MIILTPLYNHEQSQEIRESVVNLYYEKIKGTDNEARFKSQIHQWLNGKDNRIQPNDITMMKAVIFGRSDVF